MQGCFNTGHCVDEPQTLNRVGKTNLPLNESLPYKTHRSVFILFIAVASVSQYCGLLQRPSYSKCPSWLNRHDTNNRFCGPATVSPLIGSKNPSSCSRQLLLVRSVGGPSDSSQQTIYNKCVITRNKMPSTQVMCVFSLMLQHVSISEGNLECRRYTIYKYRCPQIVIVFGIVVSV
jgi:hypothetical protein